MDYNFFAFINRMKYIERWSLMRNATGDNLEEHSFQTAMFAHMLVLIDNKLFGGTLSPERAAVLALYHDAAETITGDMPTPVKYFDENMRNTYGKIETLANEKLVAKLPYEFKADFEKILDFEEISPEYKPFIKAADKISAYVKCIEEEKCGNKEFAGAKKSTYAYIRNMNLEAADYFLDNFAAAFEKTLDEIS